jgi:hypothetical protein
MSATARSVVYLAAMAHNGRHGALLDVLVEVSYVTITAGVYAGMQQNALRLRSRVLGNLIVVLGVPGVAQTLDWFTHRLTHTAATRGTMQAVSSFAVLSALFHLHVMRNDGFLTGQGHSLLDDFRRVPRFVGGFVLRPVDFLSANLLPAPRKPPESVRPVHEPPRGKAQQQMNINAVG